MSSSCAMTIPCLSNTLVPVVLLRKLLYDSGAASYMKWHVYGGIAISEGMLSS